VFADTQSPQSLRNPIAPLSNLMHCIRFEIAAEFGLADIGLLASKLGKKGSGNSLEIWGLFSMTKSK